MVIVFTITPSSAASCNLVCPSVDTAAWHCREAAPGVSPQAGHRVEGWWCDQACLPPGASSTSGNLAGMQRTQPALLLPLPKALIFPEHRFSSWCGETWRGTRGQY